jgi:peptidoglycan/xylan/chitin deacetylase (PgdA/CDA1 family)
MDVFLSLKRRFILTLIQAIMNQGLFCISLDFERFWGIRDVKNYEQIEVELTYIQDVTNKLLTIFEIHEIHATWATVGLLGHESLADLLAFNTDASISYADQHFSPYPLTKNGLAQLNESIFLAKDQIRAILKTPHQELASHTYAHYYCLENGQTIEDFKADIAKMKILGERLSHKFVSLVLPRNQVNTDYLKLAHENGIIAYRGNQINRYWKNSSFQKEGFVKKVMRVLDAYFPMSKTSSIRLKDLKKKKNGPVNIPANRFLRPYYHGKWLENRKVKRIKKEMTTAAKNGKIYHLWWHPHNFAQNQSQNFAQLKEILEHYTYLNEVYGFASMNMQEIAENAK